MRSMACTPVTRWHGRQRAYGDIDELAEAERRVLHERAFSADEEEPGHIAVVEVPAVHQRNGGAVSQVLAHAYGELEPALVPSAQFGQAVQVRGRNDALLFAPAYQGLTNPNREGGAVTLAHCWAHVRRKFYDIAQSLPPRRRGAARHRLPQRR